MNFKIKCFNQQHAFLTGFLLMIISSCSIDVLEETPLDFLAPENAYQNIEGVRQGITGLHFSVRDMYFNADNQDPLAIMSGSLGTDLAFHGENPGGNRKLVNYQSEMTSENAQFTYFWERSYQIIQRANVLIEGINVTDDAIWTNEAQKNEYLAEARFFRAWIYRFLVPLYGDVPLVTETIKSVKTDFVRTPKEEVYQLMEEDLNFAVANLPEPGNEEATGRITKGAALHTLTEVYLGQSKFQLAVDAASQAIDGGDYALMRNRFG